jgi:hypothetical protein
MSLSWLAVAACTGTPAGGSLAGPTPTASTATESKAADMRTRLSLLLAENVSLTARSSAAVLRGRAEEQAAYAELLQANGRGLTDLVGAAYGTDAELRFDKLWKLRNRVMSDYASGIAAGDQPRRDMAMSELSGSFTLELADLVHTWTGLVRETATDLARTHAAAAKQVIDDQAASRWADAYAGTRKAYGQAQRLADVLSQSMATKKPQLYPGDATTKAVALRVNLDLLLQEHGYLAAMASGAAIAGRPEEFSAAAKALNDNGSELGAVLGGIFGTEVRTRFNQAWSAQNSQLVDYTGGVIIRDSARQERALANLTESFVPAFTDLVSSVTAIPREDLARAVRDQVLATKAMIDAQAGRDAKAAEKEVAAARLTQPIGDSLAMYAARSPAFRAS